MDDVLDVSPQDGEAWCWDAIQDIYRCAMAGPEARDRQDSYLDPGVTLWDAYQEPLAIGLSGLAAMRARRAPDSERPVGLAAVDPVMERFGDVVVGRHVLLVDRSSGARERIRVTLIWRRAADRWLIVHSHEDLLPPQ